MPLSNAERQKIFRQRKRNGRHGLVTDDNGLPNSSLTRIAANLAAGMNNSQALMQAGSSRKAITLIDKAKVGLAHVLKETGLTVVKVAESTRESIEATSPMLTADGCIDRPDWTARAAGRRDAIALLDRAGELPSAQATQGGTQITVNIVRFDTPQHVVTDGQFTSSERVINTQAIANTGEND
jgi:hypothetical protein